MLNFSKHIGACKYKAAHKEYGNLTNFVHNVLMINDERQQELFLQWGRLTRGEFIEWIEQQPDKDELYDLVIQLDLIVNRRDPLLPEDQSQSQD